ncbi:hypothetical protein ACC691_40375, partial [Rhizobium johnstonii]|uniref:hypothetical protein n=1 Tax=Rhizobium johnstonii TaxID=3019933 RepID=UPI003F973E67
TSGTAASLVGAGMLTVLLLPLIGLALRKRSPGFAPLPPATDPFVTATMIGSPVAPRRPMASRSIRAAPGGAESMLGSPRTSN